MDETRLSRGQLLKIVSVRFGMGFVGLGILFFLPAGTLRYWQAWLWLATLIAPMVLVLIYLLRNDPGLLERRMRFREKEEQQRLVIRISWVWLLLAFTVPGLDRRFGWSHVPTTVVLVADALMFLSYCLFIWVMRENSYASRVIEVERGQKVISTGPYALVRHPLYVSAIALYLLSPLVLASYWAVIPAVLIIPILVFRILDEERVLVGQLPGYLEYMQKVGYRLLPGVW
jgi:protein-S-isoprenylcysteine O-methyltransferase Ste14